MLEASGDNECVDSQIEANKTTQSPVASDENTEACLNFIKQYKTDKAHGDSLVLVPPGKSAYDALPYDLKKKANLNCTEHYNESYIPSDEDLTKLITLFNESHRYLDYFSILELHSKLPKRLKDLFSPDELVSRTFCSADKMGRISKESIIKLYTDFRCRMSYDTLHSFSAKTEGFLTYNELCDFFEATLPEEDHKEKAVTTFTELILFRLDLYHKDQVAIADLLATDILDRIFGGTSDDDFFSVSRLLRVHDQFEEVHVEILNNFMDISNEGKTLEEWRREIPGIDQNNLIHIFPTVPRIFWKRLFEIYLANYFYFTDYYKYLYCVENLQEPAVIRFLFKIFDIDGDGELKINDIKNFYDDIMDIYNRGIISSPGELKLEDFYDGLYDMCGAKFPNGITLNNILNSGMSRLFFESLIDADKLKMHENADSGGIEEEE